MANKNIADKKTQVQAGGRCVKNLILRVISALILMPIFLISTHFGGFAFNALIIIAAVMIVIELYKINGDSVEEYPFITTALLGAAVMISLYMLYLIREVGEDPADIYTIAILIWSVDSGAYFIGSAVGGPKLMPSVSPKKTWSGAVGSIIFTFGVMYAIQAIDFGDYFAVKNVHPAALFVMCILAQAGDLLESKFKRYHDIKDTGSIIPGHGGVLDRIDSIIFVVPFYYFFIF